MVWSSSKLIKLPQYVCLLLLLFRWNIINTICVARATQSLRQSFQLDANFNLYMVAATTTTHS